MKEIKAYIRPEKIDPVVHALEDIGITDMTIIDVQALGRLTDPEKAKYSVEFVEKYSRIVKLEIVVDDDQAPSVIQQTLQTAYSGRPGDGMVFVAPVEDAYRIRTRRRMERLHGNGNG